MKKRVITTIYALILILAAAVPACAVDEEYEYRGDFNYSGVIDSETGYAASGSSSVNGRSRVSDGVLYDSTSGVFVFTQSDGSEVYCSAADGMIVNGTVKITASGAQILTVYKDGELFDTEGSEYIEEPGSYVVNLGPEAGTRVCGFTLVNEQTNLVHSYSVPEGFVIRSATLDDNDVEYSRYFVDMEREGFYRIETRCSSADRDYSLEVEIDRTPPQVVFSGSVGRDGRVHSAVEISGLAEDDTLYVERDGNPVNVRVTGGKTELKETGSYTVTVSDPAGNSESYDFTIMLYLDSNSILFILLLIAVIASVFIYAFWKRKTLKVR